MSEVVVDLPRDEDAEALGRMHLRSWHETYPSAEHGVDAAWVDAHAGSKDSPAAAAARRRFFAAQRSDPARTFYRVARRGGDVVGLVHATRPAEGDAVLEALYLLRAHQGTGVADRMLAAALGWLGPQPISLEVAAYNARAVAFYRRHGFRPTGATSVVLGLPTVVMRRTG
ncbi:GNAT family N-acetyltransferase [Pseudokineococcus lusitanus]|uniref:Acetyltransferase (GNAT) family protein n=1 Tax=Pseudokineococcus lusitanus TaxID=763993 RepID=A0A3N1GAI0_9ACTN|nr:GNAT family N-acetyltransferase [Pseudokineococcus lusitanus]ROP27224.1 acetyltransferase (GNAT) family protein [Pseudokineococcus lusitanus]